MTSIEHIPAEALDDNSYSCSHHHHHHESRPSRHGLWRVLSVGSACLRLAICPGDDFAAAALTILPIAPPAATTAAKEAAFRDPPAPIIEINGTQVPIT